jgi:hypothetical protein
MTSFGQPQQGCRCANKFCYKIGRTDIVCIKGSAFERKLVFYLPLVNILFVVV